MFKQNSILAIITARGGSKGLPGKNIKTLDGKPLIAWTIDAAKHSKYIDQVILSSDDADIIAVAEEYGCEIPFVRPAYLATDKIPTEPVIVHALDTLKEQGRDYDWVMLLQPTTPFRTSEDIDACLKQCFSEEKNSIVSVTSAKLIYWTFTLNETENLTPVLPGGVGTRRQDLPKTYCLNGAIYFARVSTFREQGTFIGANTGAYLMSEERSLDIDTPLDWTIAEVLTKSDTLRSTGA